MASSRSQIVPSYESLRSSQEDYASVKIDLVISTVNGAWALICFAKMFSNYKKRVTTAISPTLMLFFVFMVCFTSDFVDAHNRNRPGNACVEEELRKEFSNHYIIQPRLYHGRHKTALVDTLEEEGLHASHVTLTYELQGKRVTADLQLNENLIPQDHFLRYQKAGAGVIQNLTKTDINLCHYQGTIRGRQDSRVAISTCDGINGLIFDGAETYYIYSGPAGQLLNDHYLFRNNDMLYNATCGFKNDSFRIHEGNTGRQQPSINRMLRYKRAVDDDVIRGPYNANKHSSFVELVIVVDNKVYKSFGENMKKVYHHCKEIANIVNALYVPLNIFIALVGVVVWNESNEIELSSDGDDTLKKFLQYRRNSLVQNHPNDNAQLLTKEQFDGGVVGKALKGPICTYEYSGGVSMEHSPIVAVVATTVAHEMGHNFGMEHDTSDCKCVDEKCIMSASSTSVVPRHWSSCSIDQLNVAFSHGMNYCLRNKPTKLFESPQCGNGFVEFGEQCDCGLPEFCENSCCDPNTCMLNANASCATGECCDLMTCRPKTPGTECRSAEEECDLPEYCTGESEYCPTDVYKRDTEQCDNNKAYCYKGSCRSRSNQCKILWGPSGESSEHCYEKNTDGSRHGNCGYDRLSSKYVACTAVDVHCGMLHCKHLNERLEFGMESVAILSHSFLNHEGTIIPCRTALVDFGLQSPDPGLTPNGAKCGNGKMCVNQTCLAIGALRLNGLGKSCPNDCNGQGICNSEGHCHCYLGFSPPECTNPGQGGSVDSGPAANPNGRIGFTRAMYIFFLGVVPLIAVILLLSYYWRQNHPLQFRQSSNVTKLSMKSSPSPPGLPASTPSSTDDMNRALLRSPTDVTAKLNNNMFGKFKGFTLKPLPSPATTISVCGPNVAFVHPVTKAISDTPKSNGAPLRSAPPVPKSKITADKKINSNNLTARQNSLLSYNNSIDMPNAPALPPLNPGFNARPIISHPVLEASTCTAKELVSPLKQSNVGGLVTAKASPIEQLDVGDSKKVREGTIKRITSFLKKDDKSNSNIGIKHLPKIKPSIDREKLKNIKISAPIPVEQAIMESNDIRSNTSIARTQSMRDHPLIKKKLNIQGFGSMRQPSPANRPKSTVGMRPKSPPPPRPPAPSTIILEPDTKTSLSRLTNPRDSNLHSTINQYDDCEDFEEPLTDISKNSSGESDNIYSVIDETPQRTNKSSLLPPTGSNDSMGLLGEIVNEIEKLNVDSIYSASTIQKKKTPLCDIHYVNTSKTVEQADNEYIKSDDSITSSGYLKPSAINTPVARVAPSRPNQQIASSNAFSSFKPKNSANHPVSKSMKYTGATGKNNQTNVLAQTKYNADSLRNRSPSPSTPSKSLTTNLINNSSNSKNAPELEEIKNFKSNFPKKSQLISSNTVTSESTTKKTALPSTSNSIKLSNASKKSKLVNTPSYKLSSLSKNEKSEIPIVPTKNSGVSNKINIKNSKSSDLHVADKHSNVASLQQRFESGPDKDVSAAKTSLKSANNFPNNKSKYTE